MNETDQNQQPNENKKKTQKEPPPEGWVQVSVRRGIYEIAPLLDLCDKIGGRVIGGYARYCCSPREEPNKAGDVDIFAVGKDDEESQRIFADWQAALAAAGLEVEHENNVSLSYKATDKPPFARCPTIQLIKPIEDGAILTTGTIEDVLNNFDFTVVRIALNSDRETATAWASFLDDEQHRLLRILNIHCPISSLLRVMKYGRKGYYMRPKEALKLFIDWERRDAGYRARIAELFITGELGELSPQEIDELEALMRVD